MRAISYIALTLIAAVLCSCDWNTKSRGASTRTTTVTFAADFVDEFRLPSESLTFMRFRGSYPSGWPDGISVPEGLLLADGVIRNEPTNRGGRRWTYHALSNQSAASLANSFMKTIPERFGEDNHTEVNIGDMRLQSLQYRPMDMLITISIVESKNEPLSGKSLVEFDIITIPDPSQVPNQSQN